MYERMSSSASESLDLDIGKHKISMSFDVPNIASAGLKANIVSNRKAQFSALHSISRYAPSVGMRLFHSLH